MKYDSYIFCGCNSKPIIIAQLFLPMTLINPHTGQCYYLHFTDRETKVQKSKDFKQDSKQRLCQDWHPITVLRALATLPQIQKYASKKISRLQGRAFQSNKEQSLSESDLLVCICLPVAEGRQFQCCGNYLWHVRYGGILFGLLRLWNTTPLLLFIFTFYSSLSAILLNNYPSQT